jgi:hypothetical protein
METLATGVVERAYLALWLCDLDGDDHTTAVILDALGIRDVRARVATHPRGNGAPPSSHAPVTPASALPG